MLNPELRLCRTWISKTISVQFIVFMTVRNSIKMTYLSKTSIFAWYVGPVDTSILERILNCLAFDKYHYSFYLETHKFMCDLIHRCIVISCNLHIKLLYISYYNYLPISKNWIPGAFTIHKTRIWFLRHVRNITLASAHKQTCQIMHMSLPKYITYHV